MHVGVEIGSYSIDSPTLVLNPGTAHKKVESLAKAFIEGGAIILDTESQAIKLTTANLRLVLH